MCAAPTRETMLSRKSDEMQPEDLELLVTREMPIGKHKGRVIADLPGNYLNWFARGVTRTSEMRSGSSRSTGATRDKVNDRTWPSRDSGHWPLQSIRFTLKTAQFLRWHPRRTQRIRLYKLSLGRPETLARWAIENLHRLPRGQQVSRKTACKNAEIRE